MRKMMSLFVVLICFAFASELTAQVKLTSLRAAALVFSPVPAPQLYDRETLMEIDAFELDERWPMPSKEIVEWANVGGDPIVETRRIEELWHPVRSYEDSRRLLEMYQGNVRRLRKLNPGVDFGKLLPGELLLVWEQYTKPAQSIGGASAGFLRRAEALPPGPNYRILYPHRTFGTYYAVSEVVRVMDLFALRYPEAKPLLVGDISFRVGGKMAPHVSHRSGRDIDISFPRKNEPPNWARFQNVTPRSMDAEQMLWMIKAYIDSDQVEFMFIDRRLQLALVREARKQGAPREWINAVFQYPGAKGSRAIVRHSKGHVNHFHIRFKCQVTDRRCN